jgi:adenosylcobinamide-GDP ribazoletransferase
VPTERQAWTAPLLAVQILTRIPVPWTSRLSPAQARGARERAAGWIPLVGTLIGIFTAVVFAAATLLWPPLVAALLALAAEALLTGAFHEDAVADFCDAFGGGENRDEVRRILKDSRIGSYGALGLILAVALRAAAIAAVPPTVAFAAIVGSATLGRLSAVILTGLTPPASAEGLGASLGTLSRTTLILAILLACPGLAGIIWALPLHAAAALGGDILFLLGLRRYLLRRIGGYSGDCLGFAAYAGQLLLLLACAGKA